MTASKFPYTKEQVCYGCEKKVEAYPPYKNYWCPTCKMIFEADVKQEARFIHFTLERDMADPGECNVTREKRGNDGAGTGFWVYLAATVFIYLGIPTLGMLGYLALHYTLVDNSKLTQATYRDDGSLVDINHPRLPDRYRAGVLKPTDSIAVEYKEKAKSYSHSAYCDNCRQNVLIKIPFGIRVGLYEPLAMCPNCGVSISKLESTQAKSGWIDFKQAVPKLNVDKECCHEVTQDRGE